MRTRPVHTPAYYNLDVIRDGGLDERYLLSEDQKRFQALHKVCNERLRLRVAVLPEL